ncbi:MAG: transcriptional regulator [Planctomycetota bacterium]
MSAQTGKSGRPLVFFASRPVFTHAEFVAAHAGGGRSPHTSNALLAKHLASGRLLRIRRGLYAAVPSGVDPEEFSPDPYLVATQLREDAVVGYHAALSFHGKAYSVWRRFSYLTADRARPFAFRGQEFVAVQVPGPVRSLPDFGGGVVTRTHASGPVRVTSLERSFVDLLHAPQHGGGWEEIWRSLEMIEFFDLAEVARYALLLGSALTAARVGFFLEQHRDALMVEEKHLAPFRERAPAQPRYLSSRREPGRLVPRWNLIVPEAVLERRWEEPG